MRMEQSKISLELADGIAHLMLDSAPENRMDSQFFEEFNALLSAIHSRPDLKGLIIQARGRHFSAGADVAELTALFRNAGQEIPTPIAKNSEAFRVLSNLDVPVVACIKGICYGSGLELALCAHFRIAADKALLSLPETGFGIMPGLGGIYHSTRCMGSARAMELVLSGYALSSGEALEQGLVDLVVPREETTDKARSIVELTEDAYRKELKAVYLKEFSRLT